MRIAALALGGALTLGACGSADQVSGSTAVAATVQGHTITIGEVQLSSREVGEFVAAQAEGSGQPPQDITPDQLIGSLVQVPTLLEYATAHDIPVPSAATIEKQLDTSIQTPSRTTVGFFRANAVYAQLTPEQQQEIAEQVQGLDMTISPRYRPDGQGPDWLKTSGQTPEKP